MSVQPFIFSAESLVPSSSQDVVAVYNQDWEQVFSIARPTELSVKKESKLMEHPLEDGSTIIDHSVIQPIEADLTVVLQPGDYQQGYLEISQLFLNRTYLILQSRGVVYENMIIRAMPHEESPDYYNTLYMIIKLREAQFVTPETTIAPRNPTDKSTVNRGTTQTEVATPVQEREASVIHRWAF